MKGKPDVSVTDETLSFEQRAWSYYPLSLTKEQQLNPYLFLEAFFGKYNLPQYREHLYDWLEYGLSVKPAGEFMEAEDLLTVNENLQKLFDAAWFIFQRTSAKPSLRNDVKEEKVLFSLSANLSSAEREAIPVSMYQLDSGLQGKQSALISSIVSIIIHKINSVKAIVYLGAAPLNKLYLLVLTDNEEQRQSQGLAGMIEDSCRETANVVALVHHSSALFTGLKRGNRFMNTALTRSPAYLSGDLL
ncbi:hypothetical protein [Mucilaginibacter glaciei]|uniref:Uncharacterized protein n=1 Tax=Mucilaginibacter glaciei TaxID=2772109 RepID=A0A926NNW0_9SPHI|nr:hypothetical protein [Mucilaginibacter glaciei]MBD1394626.1 hypothetical protein [Mucilaginibacter glaciei]